MFCFWTNMNFYVIFLFLCFYGLYVVFEVIYQNYLDEFGMDKTQPLTTDVIEKLINLILEHKICSKFKKPLPSVPSLTEYHYIKVLYFIISCTICTCLGFISGIHIHKKRVHPEQNLQERNGYLYSYNSDNDEPSTCSLCLNVFKPRLLLLPCKHICICTDCWTRFDQENEHNNYCPICRKYVEEIMNVYCT